jgi:LPS-assembly protein
LETSWIVPRTDFAPEINTAFHWDGFSLVPSFSARETTYGQSIGPSGVYNGGSVFRTSREFKADLLLPSFERIFNAPSWIGQKIKHVIEPRITYTDNSGIHNFGEIIRFDDTDVLSNTNQVEFSLTNRLLAKSKDGTVTDFLTWQLWYDRYFDPTFGGAVVPGQRNVVQAILDLTGYSFLDGYRHSSPVVNALRLQQGRMTLDWRVDYDPLVHRIINSSASVNWRLNKYFFNFGDTDLKTDPVLAPRADQISGTIGYGQSTKRGWGAAFGVFYDVLKGAADFMQFQVTYNTDCCGFSMQYRRFDLATRDESFYRFAFTISNIGSMGSLSRQERMF